MSEGLGVNGYLSSEELKRAPGSPSLERMLEGPVVVIECIQEIPCNPCEEACPKGAITVGSPITNLPQLDEEKCIGCGICLSSCPGLAIFLVDLTHSDKLATVAFPYEYFPLPEVGQWVTTVDRAGRQVCEGEVVKVSDPTATDRTPIVTVAVSREHASDVRGILRSRR